MTSTSPLHHRRSIRLKGYDYTQPGAYFITLVAWQRENLFGEIRQDEVVLNKMGLVASQEWGKIPRRFPRLELGAFVIMPNHMHGILIIHEDRIATVVGARRRIETAMPLDSPAVPLPGDNPSSSCRAPTRRRIETAMPLDSPAVPLPGDNPSSSCRAPTIESFGRPVPGSIPTILRSYKSTVTLRINRLRHTPGFPVWQRNYYEHIIRNPRDHQAIHDYILANHANWESDDEHPPPR
ncbi:MAG: hypothetical protein JW726_07695 [Anaerolineales bacterium]|nr:hypothetical protein [Anaerolineales bacterium]